VISTFGAKARAYADRLGDIEAIVVEPEVIGDGYREAVRRREQGESVYGLVLIDDPRVAFGYLYGEQILAQLPGYDVRQTAIDQLAGVWLWDAKYLFGLNARVVTKPHSGDWHPIVAYETDLTN